MFTGYHNVWPQKYFGERWQTYMFMLKVPSKEKSEISWMFLYLFSGSVFFYCKFIEMNDKEWAP